MPEDLVVGVHEHLDHIRLRPRGWLSLRNVPRVREVTVKSLLGTGRVVIDLSRLRCTQPAFVTVFPTALAIAGGWPSARLILYGADGAMRSILMATRIPDTVQLAADLASARTLFDRRPPASTTPSRPTHAQRRCGSRETVRARILRDLGGGSGDPGSCRTFVERAGEQCCRTCPQLQPDHRYRHWFGVAPLGPRLQPDIHPAATADKHRRVPRSGPASGSSVVPELGGAPARGWQDDLDQPATRFTGIAFAGVDSACAAPAVLRCLLSPNGRRWAGGRVGGGRPPP
jgi:hypothetical protein